jgi:hypothetical protein
MEDPLTLTTDMLEGILRAVVDKTPHLANGVYASGTVTDTDIHDINEELKDKLVSGPVMVIDIAANAGVMHPSNIGAVLNNHNNTLETIAEEAKKGREATEFGLQNIVTHLKLISDSINGASSYGVLAEIRDAVRSISDASILSTPLPAGDDDQLEAAADRVLELLNRRPDLKAAVEAKLK